MKEVLNNINTTMSGEEKIKFIYESAQEGQKFSENKVPLYTMISKQFPKAIIEIAKCSMAGHKKYENSDKDWLNFKRVMNAEFHYKNAAFRHSLEKGINQDMLEFGEILHEAQTIWNLLAALECKLSEEVQSS